MVDSTEIYLYRRYSIDFVRTKHSPLLISCIGLALCSVILMYRTVLVTLCGIEKARVSSTIIPALPERYFYFSHLLLLVSQSELTLYYIIVMHTMYSETLRSTEMERVKGTVIG